MLQILLYEGFPSVHLSVWQPGAQISLKTRTRRLNINSRCLKDAPLSSKTHRTPNQKSLNLSSLKPIITIGRRRVFGRPSNSLNSDGPRMVIGRPSDDRRTIVRPSSDGRRTIRWTVVGNVRAKAVGWADGRSEPTAVPFFPVGATGGAKPPKERNDLLRPLHEKEGF